MCRLPLLCAAIAAAALCGCGRGDVREVAGTTVALTTADYRIAPQDLAVGRGRITFTVRNDGHLPHNFVLERGTREIGRIATLLPGETGTATMRLRRGTYTMLCTQAHHRVLGEFGTVTVR